jgi:predicted DNA-binding transcriptional regulator
MSEPDDNIDPDAYDRLIDRFADKEVEDDEPKEEKGNRQGETGWVSQWRILKMIEATDKKSMALGDIARELDIDRNSDRIQKPLGQLLRGDKITQAVGQDLKGAIGNVYTVKRPRKPTGRERAARDIEDEPGYGIQLDD